MLLYYTFQDNGGDKFHSFAALSFVASTVVFVVICSAAAYFWRKLPTDAKIAGYGSVGSNVERSASDHPRRELIDAHSLTETTDL